MVQTTYPSNTLTPFPSQLTAMDWFSWLSKTGLDASLVYEYALAFSQNELEEEDVSYFNHEFLQSMGISIAKHRLEILKLARKERGGSAHAISRLVIALKRTKRCLAKYIRTWARREESALVVVPRPGYGSRWKGAMLKRNKKRVTAATQGRLMLTNGSPEAASKRRIDSFFGPVVDSAPREEKCDADGYGEDDGYWSTVVEEIRWDTLFQDLKPT